MFDTLVQMVIRYDKDFEVKGIKEIGNDAGQIYEIDLEIKTPKYNIIKKKLQRNLLRLRNAQNFQKDVEVGKIVSG